MIPVTLIVDIDGTLADDGHRKDLIPDWDRYFDAMGEDTPHHAIVELVNAMYESGYYVVLCTGRPDSHREDTEAWLLEHEISHHDLRMRAAGDHRSSVEVKSDLVPDSYLENVLFAIDDRNQDVAMWRSRGIPCLQPRDGDF